MPVRPELRIAELGHQLLAFRETSPSDYARQFETHTIYLIEFVATHTSPPASVKNYRFPANWEIDRPSINAAVLEFRRLIENTSYDQRPDYLEWVGITDIPEANNANPTRPLGVRSRASSNASSRGHPDFGKGKAKAASPNQSPSQNLAPADNNTELSPSAAPSTPTSANPDSSDPLNAPATVRPIRTRQVSPSFDI
ncbi:hypothetical protein BDV18DRAFT_159544 [Aspergillus unguis]